MKLKWPLWLIVTAWFLLHLIAFLSFPFGSPIQLINIPWPIGCIIYIAWGAFAQSVGYGVIVGKKTLAAWKLQSKDSTRVSSEDTNASIAWGYVFWLAIPAIIYIPFYFMAIADK